MDKIVYCCIPGTKEMLVVTAKPLIAAVAKYIDITLLVVVTSEFHAIQDENCQGNSYLIMY